MLTGPVRGSSSPEAEFCWDTLSPFLLRAFTYRLGPTGTWAGRTDGGDGPEVAVRAGRPGARRDAAAWPGTAVNPPGLRLAAASRAALQFR
ncbi:hypothetical protein GCM10010504_55480 [Streptomyces griseus]|nr:hypothetical protein GCM10010504_55480 [Streptomyces griseus]